jgi:rod shape-determining protein MreD
MSHKIKLRLLGCLPMLATFFLVLLTVAPKHIANLSNIMPMLYLAPIFIWAVMHPRDMNWWFLAAIGLFIDIATGLPLSLSALCILFFFLLARSQRKYIYKEGFVAMWGYFSLILLAMQIVGWGLYSYHQHMWAAAGGAFLQWLFTVMLYPPLHRFFYPFVEKMAHARYQLLHV